MVDSHPRCAGKDWRSRPPASPSSEPSPICSAHCSPTCCRRPPTSRQPHHNTSSSHTLTISDLRSFITPVVTGIRRLLGSGSGHRAQIPAHTGASLRSAGLTPGSETVVPGASKSARRPGTADVLAGATASTSWSALLGSGPSSRSSSRRAMTVDLIRASSSICVAAVAVGARPPILWCWHVCAGGEGGGMTFGRPVRASGVGAGDRAVAGVALDSLDRSLRRRRASCSGGVTTRRRLLLRGWMRLSVPVGYVPALILTMTVTRPSSSSSGSLTAVGADHRDHLAIDPAVHDPVSDR